ncbi:MAG: 3-dehydroquinate synthase [Endozoicomonas sp.]
MKAIGYRARWSILLAVIISAILLLFFLFNDPVTKWTETTLSTTSHPATISTITVFLLTFDVILPVPSSIVSIAASTILGLLWSTASIWLGLMLGCIFGYWLGARCTSQFLYKVLGQKEFLRAEQLSNRIGISLLVAMRAVPVLAETSVITAGIVRMPLIKFLLSTALANVGLALAYAYIGSQADMKNPLLLIIFGSILVATLSWAVERGIRQIKRKNPRLNLIRHKTSNKKKSINSSATLHANLTIDYSYDVFFTESVFSPENKTLLDALQAEESSRSTKAVVLIDSGLTEESPELEDHIRTYFNHHSGLIQLLALVEIAGGEVGKDAAAIEKIYQTLFHHQLDRHSYVIAIGGGAALDTIGFATASFHRGLRLIRLPTTVLAQNDAGIGVKNGINAFNSKNLIGSFSPPSCIINDLQFLETLSSRDKRSGIAEAVKVAAIRDRDFCTWLEENASRLARFEKPSMHYMIYRCAELHLQQICQGGDPFEKGQARPLDYGHWCAHKLEALTKYQLRHGEAVAIGMALDARYSFNTGLLSEYEFSRLISLLENLEFTLWHPALEWEQTNGSPLFMDGLDEFRQHLGGDLCITLLSSLGRGIEVSTMDNTLIIRARDWLKKRYSQKALSKNKPSTLVTYC